MAHHHHHRPSESPEQRERILQEELDAAGQSLTKALQVSFTILKGIIIVLLIVFACSGIFQVQEGEQALKLFFGEIDGPVEDPVLKPGIKFAFPEPIHEIIRIPVTRELSIPIDTFWYYESPEEKIRQVKRTVTGPLDPLMDGYCLTGNDSLEGLAGTDYNIVHSMWTVTYKIDDPKDFFENVYIRDREPGEDLLEAAADTLNPMLESLASNAIVRTMVNYSIDEAIKSEARIADDVKTVLQDKLNMIQCGIKVSDVRAGRIIWPRQVDAAFQASSNARQESDRIKTDASSYKDELLTDTGGPEAEAILEQLKQPDLTQAQQEELVSRLSGQVQSEIAAARLYRTKVVEDAKANAEYLEKLLPEYEKNPKLVLLDIYQKAIQEVMDNADEKIFIQTREGLQDEIRFLINRDPNVKKEKAKNADKTN